MLRLFNTLGKRIEAFRPVNRKVVNIFTCGPSVYQRSHIGNFRTFLFEDILVRYLKYSGYKLRRGMNFTDLEDKALKEAEKRKVTFKSLTERNIKEFIKEMKFLRMKIPDYIPKASECIDEAVNLMQLLLNMKTAYMYKGDIYFNPLKFNGFGKLYGLDMSKWPKKRRRFHKDTYPGMQWNLGDFILWDGYKMGDRYYWDTKIGKGRPSWNIQDPSMISKHFNETLSIYCGGIDNLFRHHDYTLAILESVRPYPMARFWLHCNHLFVNGKKMSKSRGNILYTDTLQKMGYKMSEIRFFLIYGHYRERINYSEMQMRLTVNKLRTFKSLVNKIRKRTKEIIHHHQSLLKGGREDYMIKNVFTENMDNDLDVKGAFDGIYEIISGINVEELKPGEASGIIKTLREIDEVFRVVF
jgi:cysteinyl-tRNA synthetase